MSRVATHMGAAPWVSLRHLPSEQSLLSLVDLHECSTSLGTISVFGNGIPVARYQSLYVPKAPRKRCVYLPNPQPKCLLSLTRSNYS